MRKWAFLLAFLMLPGLAQVVIINSNDWRFVLLSMEYAHYQGDDVIFLISESQADIIAKNLVGDGITVFEDSDPIVDDYAQYIKNFYDVEADSREFDGYSELQEYLLRVLTPEDLFVASTLEPENTLISVPLAYKENGVVLFQSSGLFSRLSDFEDIYAVGGLKRDFRRELLSVAALLEKDVMEIDQGSPYSNSLALLDEWGETDKLYISTGSFLEPTLLDGRYPLVLVGSGGYSDGFLDVLDEVGVDTVFVIGTRLMEVARRIRDDSNKEIRVIVKYGETYTSAGYAGTVFALSTYKVPIPQPNVTLANVLYDTEEGKLYVKYGNYGDGLAYVSTVTRIARDGTTLTSITDDETFLLWPGDEIVRVYSIDLTDYGLSNLDANVYARYGRYTDFLVNILDVTAPLQMTRVVDRSSISIERATYDGRLLRVYVRNDGSVDAYVSGEIALELDGDTERFQLSGVRLPRGRTSALQTRIRLTDEDVDNNEFVEAFLKYGESQDLLINTIRRKVQLEVVKIRLELLAAPVLAALLIILLISVVSRLRRRRYYRAGRRIRRFQRNILGSRRTRGRRPRGRRRR